MTDEYRYEWQSSGGCTRCDAMNNRYTKTTPSRPHPNCNCTILNRYARNTECDESDVRYDISHAGNSHHGPTEPDDEFDMYFDYLITCWGNAEKIEGQVTITMTYDDVASMEVDDFFEEAFGKALNLVDEIALSECPLCTKPLVA